MDYPIDQNRGNKEAVISMLRSSHAAISAVLLSSIAAERDIADTDRRLLLRRRSLAAISGPATRPHSQAFASKALHGRIALAERLEGSLVDFGGSEHIAKAEYEAVEFMWRTKAVEFMWRTKAVDRTRMNYKGEIAEALLRLQDEYRKMLRRLRHADVEEMACIEWKTNGEDRLEGEMDCCEWWTLGSAEERDVLRRLTEILASNGCIDTCINVFVKARRRQVTKALSQLNQNSINKYKSKDVRRNCQSVDPAISLWISHIRIAVTSLLPAEKHLCRAVLSAAMDETIWSECFAKISHRIMLVLFRIGEQVAYPPSEPLINLLKMADTAYRLRSALSALFDDCVPKISSQARELEKLIVGSAFRAFSALSLRIDAIQNDFPPPTDASVPSVVICGVNFLKCVAADRYERSMAQLYQEQDFKESFEKVLDALQRNVEAIWEKFEDRIAAHVFAMNTNWYIYIKTRGSELAILVGEEKMRRKYKGAVEAAAYAYQAEAWEPMVRMLEKGDVGAFTGAMQDNLRRHRKGYGIQDADLREQIKEAVLKMLVSAYEGCLDVFFGMVQGSGFLPMKDLKAMIGWIFDDGGGNDRGVSEQKVVDERLASAAMVVQGGERVKGERRRRARRGTRRGTRLQFSHEVESKTEDWSSVPS
ncbi:exocyst complex component EXO70B1-like [Phalaenopsis equestris]|uniref:exocyst complex component EXO70B1-like n=1 Tax=Phalaenopsis equestris TaxID=78828 RepID=UPI0009E287E2|nr:exocyst complex component EXO70B1-like [Phalaenopsis equestris]